MTKLILALDCDEKAFDAAREKTLEQAEKFLKAHPNAKKKWNQAVTARFLIETMETLKGPAEIAALALECANSSALRQALAKAGLINDGGLDEF